jgi:Ca2+-transporting ATPase
MGDKRDLQRRANYFGPNTKPAARVPTLGDSIKEAFKDYILLVIAICAAFSIIFGMIYDPKTGWVEGVAIIAVLAIMIIITSLNDWFKDKRFVELASASKDAKLPVFRGKRGQMQTVDMWKMVVGDVVILNAGNIVPADCILIKGERFSVTEPIDT